jgi:hypothetical protein
VTGAHPATLVPRFTERTEDPSACVLLGPGSYVFHARVVATNGRAVASYPVTVTVDPTGLSNVPVLPRVDETVVVSATCSFENGCLGHALGYNAAGIAIANGSSVAGFDQTTCEFYLDYYSPLASSCWETAEAYVGQSQEGYSGTSSTGSGNGNNNGTGTNNNNGSGNGNTNGNTNTTNYTGGQNNNSQSTKGQCSGPAVMWGLGGGATIGGNPFLVGGLFFGVSFFAGANLTHGQVIISVQLNRMVGLGVFGGVGASKQVGVSSGPVESGPSRAFYGEANAAMGKGVGASVQYDGQSLSGSKSAKVAGRAGVGGGLMVGVGDTHSFTLASHTAFCDP